MTVSAVVSSAILCGLCFLPLVRTDFHRFPIGQKGFPQRTLHLCGEMFESSSALICVNLRLKIFFFYP